MEYKDSKRRFIRPFKLPSHTQICNLVQNNSSGKLTFGEDSTPKKNNHYNPATVTKSFKTPVSKERSLEMKFQRGNQTRRLKEQNTLLHEKNMKLLREIKGLSREDSEQSYAMSTDRKEYRPNKMETSKKRRDEFEDRNTMEKKHRKNDEWSQNYHSSRDQAKPGDNSDDESYNSEISYLLLCIQQREDIIHSLKQQLSQSRIKQQETGKRQAIFAKQLQQKQDIIRSLTKKLDAVKEANIKQQIFQQPPNQLFQVKKENYALKLRINELTHQLVSSKQKKKEMEAMICELYFDHQFKTQEEEMVSELKISCKKARTQFKRIIKQNQNYV